MRETRLIMGMPVTLVVLDVTARQDHLDTVFEGFVAVDNRFSPYKEDSEICRINRGEVRWQTKAPGCAKCWRFAKKPGERGYFNIARPDGFLDPCGMVKGWAILNAARRFREMGFENYYVDAGGDIQAGGKNEGAKTGAWVSAIPSIRPRSSRFSRPGAAASPPRAIIFAVRTSIIRIPGSGSDDIVSLTVIGPDVLEADRYATAAFAMGREGIYFIERMAGLEGYEIDATGMARMTAGLGRYLTC